MKIIRTLIMVVLAVVLMPVITFADEEIPEAVPSETEVTAAETEEDTAVPEETQDTPETEEMPEEETAVIPEPEEPAEEVVVLKSQAEGADPKKQAFPFDSVAERLRCSEYVDILALRIKESECDALFNFLCESCLIEDGYDISFVFEGGYISLVILEKEESEEPEASKAEEISQREYVMAPVVDTETVSEPEAPAAEPVSEEAPVPVSAEEGNDIPIASFYGSLLILIGAAKHILSAFL